MFLVSLTPIVIYQINLARQGDDDYESVAETRGFEPPNPFLGYLISSEAHSTGLCDVSEYLRSLQVDRTNS